MKRYFFYILLFVSFAPATLFAASLSVDGGAVLPTKGQQSVSVFLDTEGTMINAIEGDILVFGDADIVDIRDGSSFVSLWTEKLSFKGNSAHFSGIIPGGFNGAGEVLSLVLHGTGDGSATISFSNVAVFLDDGLGTEEKINTEKATLGVSSDIQGDVESDVIPPEPFSIGLINVSEDPAVPLYALIFATDDKQTGIDHYEVQEIERGEEPLPEGWKEATSPYILTDQTRTADFYVRAFDNTGNIQEARFKEERANGMIGLVVLGLILLFCCFFLIRRYARIRTKKH